MLIAFSPVPAYRRAVEVGLMETANRKTEREWVVLVSEQINGLTNGVAGHRI